MLRLVLSVVAGLAIAILVVFASDALVPAAAAMPADTADAAAMAAYVAGQPTAVLVGLVIGWGLAALVGSYVAARGARRGEWPG